MANDVLGYYAEKDVLAAEKAKQERRAKFKETFRSLSVEGLFLMVPPSMANSAKSLQGVVKLAFGIYDGLKLAWTCAQDMPDPVKPKQDNSTNPIASSQVPRTDVLPSIEIR